MKRVHQERLYALVQKLEGRIKALEKEVSALRRKDIAGEHVGPQVAKSYTAEARK